MRDVHGRERRRFEQQLGRFQRRDVARRRKHQQLERHRIEHGVERQLVERQHQRIDLQRRFERRNQRGIER
jgi:hypothetical protein